LKQHNQNYLYGALSSRWCPKNKGPGTSKSLGDKGEKKTQPKKKNPGAVEVFGKK